MLERMAVIWGGGALGGGSHMGKDKIRGSFGGDSLQVGVIPSGCGRGEDAWVGAQLGAGVIAYPEAIGIIRSAPCVLNQRCELMWHGQELWCKAMGRRLGKGRVEWRAQRRETENGIGKRDRAATGDRAYVGRTSRRRESKLCLRME